MRLETPPPDKPKLTDTDRARLAAATIRNRRRLKVLNNRRGALMVLAGMFFGNRRIGGAN